MSSKRHRIIFEFDLATVTIIKHKRYSLSSMDVKTTNPIHHLIFGGGIVRSCTVLCLIDMYGHR